MSPRHGINAHQAEWAAEPEALVTRAPARPEAGPHDAVTAYATRLLIKEVG
jgi:hypothetical protein